MLLAVAGCAASERAEPIAAPRPAEAQASNERERVLGPFLDAYWRLPSASRGARPEGLSEAESSLDPQVCGACHPQPYAEWRTSLHAAAYELESRKGASHGSSSFSFSDVPRSEECFGSDGRKTVVSGWNATQANQNPSTTSMPGGASTSKICSSAS